jgi:hypothetical protein
MHGIRSGGTAAIILRSAGTALVLSALLTVSGCNRRDEATSRAEPPATVAGQPGEQSHWAPYAEPTEHAFTVELPEGWPAQGGLRRLTTGEVRYWLRASAPDGSVEIFFGDPEIPDFTPPTPALAEAGLIEGRTYMPGEGRAFTVSPYHEGQAFAAEWGRGKLGGHCDQVTPTGGQSLPDASTRLETVDAPAPPRTQVKAGETRFRCVYRGLPAQAWVFAATGLDARGPFEVWDARLVGGLIAQTDRRAIAVAALAHAARSFTPDAEWLKRQPGWSGDRMRATPRVLPVLATAAEASPAG